MSLIFLYFIFRGGGGMGSSCSSSKRLIHHNYCYKTQGYLCIIMSRVIMSLYLTNSNNTRVLDTCLDTCIITCMYHVGLQQLYSQ